MPILRSRITFANVIAPNMLKGRFFPCLKCVQISTLIPEIGDQECVYLPTDLLGAAAGKTIHIAFVGFLI